MSRKLVERVSETPNPCAPDPISADELRSGSWLLRVARSNFQRFGEIAETSVYPTLTRLTWGSLCSGSEGVYFVMQAINAAVDAAWQDFVLEHKFSCEIVPDKRCWIEAVAECGPAALKHLQQQGRSNTKQKAWDDGEGCKPGEAEDDAEDIDFNPDLFEAPPDSSEMPCRFCDITDMGNRMSKCTAHGDKCFVPHVDLLVVGTSCRDLSKANPNKSKNQNVLQQATSRGGSAQTFRGMLAYLDAQRPPLVCYENVDALLEDSSSSGCGNGNFEVLLHEFHIRGYQAQATICEASKFGLPCRRRRLYVVFVQMAANNVVDFAKRPVAECFSYFRQFLGTCMREAASLEEVLRPDDDEAVLAELAARRSKAQEPMSSVGQAEWPEAHMRFAQGLQMMWTQSAGEHLQQNPWYHTLGNREKNALPLLQAHMPQRLAMVRDLSQSIMRANALTWQADLGRHVCPTLLSKMNLWLEDNRDSSKARLLLGREALSLQGFPIYAFLQVLQESNFCEDRQGQGLQTGSAKATAASSSKKRGGETKFEQGPPAGNVDRPPSGFPSEGLMADLAGNAMALPVIMGVVQSLLSCLEWRDSENAAPVAQVEDVDSACAAVALLQRQSGSASAGSDVPGSRGAFKRLRRA